MSNAALPAFRRRVLFGHAPDDGESYDPTFGDVASLAWKWNKPLSARLQPVKGKRAGERTEFKDPYLFNTTVHPLV